MKDIVAETPRLTVRRFVESDWRDLYEYLSDPDVVRYEPYDVYTEEECKLEAAKRAADEVFLAVVLKETNKLIGNITLSPREFSTWELGYVFNAAYQGQGYATESAKAVMEYAFTALKARRMSAMCNPDNTRSWKLLQRLGMRREGLLKQNVYFKTDENNQPIWMDTCLYALLASEWQEQYEQ